MTLVILPPDNVLTRYEKAGGAAIRFLRSNSGRGPNTSITNGPRRADRSRISTEEPGIERELPTTHDLNGLGGTVTGIDDVVRFLRHHRRRDAQHRGSLLGEPGIADRAAARMTRQPPVLRQVGEGHGLDLERVGDLDLERDQIGRHERNVGVNEQLQRREREAAGRVHGGAAATVPSSSSESRALAVELRMREPRQAPDDHAPGVRRQESGVRSQGVSGSKVSGENGSRIPNTYTLEPPDS